VKRIFLFEVLARSKKKKRLPFHEGKLLESQKLDQRNPSLDVESPSAHLYKKADFNLHRIQNGSDFQGFADPEQKKSTFLRTTQPR
jgi:hypothetical protein